MKPAIKSDQSEQRKYWVLKILIAISFMAAGMPFILERSSGYLPQGALFESVSQPKYFMVGGDPTDELEFIAEQYELVVWRPQPKIKEKLSALRKGNDGFKALMYRQAFCILEQESLSKESVGEYDWISERHPEWFQLDSRGHRVEVPDSPGHWMMDFSNSGWQKFWIQRTLRDVVQEGWDGVFADNVLTTIKAHDLPRLNRYTTDEKLQDAVTSFLSRAYPEFQKAGKLFIANVSKSYEYPGLLEKWLEYTDGFMEENFGGEAWYWGTDVAENQLFSTMVAAQRNKWVLNLTYGKRSERQKMQSSLAAHLVVAGSKGHWHYRPDHGSSKAAWDFSWDVDLGEPVEDTDVKGDLWQRRFEHGVALVNTGKHTRIIELDGKEVVLEAFQGKVVSTRSEPR